jgi:hypothetical protein
MRGMTINIGEADSENMSHFPMNTKYGLPSVMAFMYNGRSQWRSGLRHEMSSLARTRVRFPLMAWMFV